MIDQLLDLRLPDEHYREAMQHESSLVCLILVDRKLLQSLQLRAEWFIDPLWLHLYEQLTADCFASLRQLIGKWERWRRREIAETIVDARGLPRVFHWNARWHASEMERLYTVRMDFISATDFLAEHMECSRSGEG